VKKSTSIKISKVLLASSLLFGSTATPVFADSVSDYVDRVVAAYQGLGEDGQTALTAVRTNIQNLSATQWTEILTVGSTDVRVLINAKLTGAGDAAAEAIIEDLVDILYTTDTGLQDKVGTFKANYAGEFDKIFSEGVDPGNSIEIFFNYLNAFETELEIAVLGAILTDSTQNMNDIIAAAADVAAADTGLEGLLFNNLGIGIADLLQIKDNLNAQVDPTNEARNALIQGAAEYKGLSIVEYKNSLHQTLSDITDSAVLKIAYTLNGAEGHTANLVEWSTSNTSIASFSSNTLTVHASGSVTINAELLGQTILSETINVTKSSTGGGGGGGGGGSTTPTEGEDLGDTISDIATGDSTPEEKAAAISQAVANFKDAIFQATSENKDAVFKDVKQAAKVATSHSVLKDMDAATTKQVLDAMVTNLGSAAQENKQISRSLVKLAEDYVKKAATESVQAAIEGNQAKAAPTASQLNDAFANALKAKNEVLGQLEDAGLNTTSLKTVIKIELQAEGSPQVQSITFDLTDLSSAAGDAADNAAINIATKGASIVLSLQNMQSTQTTAKNSASAASEHNSFELVTTQVELTGDTQSLKPLSGVTPLEISATSKGQAVTSFNNEVTISLDAPNLPAGTDAEKVAAYQLVDGKWVPVGGVYDGGQVTFQTRTLGTFAVFISERSFNDLTSVSSWAEKEIEVLVAKGVANGRSESSFDPNGEVTRAEFAKLVVRSLGLYDPNVTAEFSDVHASDWFAADVASAVKYGIVTGVGNGKFAPHAKITREQMATMAARALAHVGASVTNVDAQLEGFADANAIESWARESVALSVNEDVIKGVTDSTFAPKQFATRAQAAVIIYRTMNAK
jgi:hypothetical protein